MNVSKYRLYRAGALTALAITASVMACSDQGSDEPERATLSSSPITAADIKTLYSPLRVGNLMEDLVALGPRVAGRPVEHQASKIIRDEFERYGLAISVEHYPVTVHWRDFCGSKLTFEGNALEPMDMKAMSFSPPGKATARLIRVGLGFPEDYTKYAPREKGYLALVERGIIPFAFKAQFAFEAGAIGVIVVNRAGDTSTSFNAATSPIPIAFISREQGERLFAKLRESPEMKANFVVNTERRLGPSWQVIGTLAGTEPDAGTLYVTAHYDSNALSGPILGCPYAYDYDFAGASPGANDNASGTAAIVEAARVMSKLPRPRASVKFIAFGGEEVGLSGSLAYVLAHRDEVMAPALGNINLDMVGVGNNLFVGNLSSPPDLVEYALLEAEQMGTVVTPMYLPQSSDHAAFEWSGVPSVAMVALGGTPDNPLDDPNYHQVTDNLDNDQLSPILVEKAGELATMVAYEFANLPQSAPVVAAVPPKGELKCRGRCNHK